MGTGTDTVAEVAAAGGFAVAGMLAGADALGGDPSSVVSISMAVSSAGAVCGSSGNGGCPCVS